MTNTIIILRHGKTEAGEKWLYCGSTDLPLSEGGKAGLTELKNTYGYPDVSGYDFYTTGMLRTNETLNILYGDVPYESVPALREMDFGIFEMRNYDELKDIPEYVSWLNDPENVRVPGGGSSPEMKARVLSAFSDIAAKGRDSVIVMHGGPISAIMDSLFPNENKSRIDWQPDAGCGYEILFEDGEPVSYRAVPSR